MVQEEDAAADGSGGCPGLAVPWTLMCFWESTHAMRWLHVRVLEEHGLQHRVFQKYLPTCAPTRTMDLHHHPQSRASVWVEPGTFQSLWKNCFAPWTASLHDHGGCWLDKDFHSLWKTLPCQRCT